MGKQTLHKRVLMHITNMIILVSVCILSTVSPALAQSTRDSINVDTIKHERIAEVLVTGKTAIRKVKEQALNINVIDAKELYNTSADLNAALNRSTGVRIRCIVPIFQEE